MTSVKQPKSVDRASGNCSNYQETTKNQEVLTTMATATQTTFKPLGNRVVVKPSEGEEQMSAGGIYIPDTAKEKPQEGEVVAVGPGRLTDDGNRVPMEIAVGDMVVYSKYAGTEYKEGDDEYLVLREDDILFKK